MQVCLVHTRPGSWKVTSDYVLSGTIRPVNAIQVLNGYPLKISVAGTYIFDASEVRLAQLLLQRAHWKVSNSKIARHQKGSRPVLVRIPKDLSALDVHLGLPNHSDYTYSRI